MKPMLAKGCESLAAVAEMIRSDDWAIEPKADGIRLLVCYDHEQDSVKAFTRTGLDQRLAPAMVNDIKWFVSVNFAIIDDQKIWLDGELVDKVLYVFDAPHFPHTYAARRHYLEMAGERTTIKVMPAATNVDAKQRLVATILANGGEGVVCKRMDSLYVQGRSPYWLKVKRYHSAECVVMDTNIDGKSNAEVGLYDADGNLTSTTTVSTYCKFPVNVGDVVEVKYLTASRDHRLVQPELLKIRTDKQAADCTFDQLIYHNASIIRDLAANASAWA